MKILISHPTGNANVRAAAEALAQNRLLCQFYTTIAVFQNTFLYKLGSLPLMGELHRRTYNSILKPYAKNSPLYEVGRVLSSRLGVKRFQKSEDSLFSVDSIYRHLDKTVAHELSRLQKIGLNAVYAYEDGALETFKKAKELELTCFYDLPIGYWRAAREMLTKESLVRPEWAETMTGLADSEEKTDRKDMELSLADQIFVASSFTAKTLDLYPGKLNEVKVIPYGFPSAYEDRTYNSITNRKLKVLFVGGLSQRKGIANVFEAADRLKNHIELTVVGRASVADCKVLNDNLSKHKWFPSLPHSQILELMRSQDVLVFPSLFEGFGLVITEAMSQGTPVITTDRTVGPDIITHNVDGWITEAGSTNSLLNQLELILSRSKILEEAGRLSVKKAKSRPWSVYQKEIIDAILE
ncbi:glycosyltransferase [Dysgonomonas sp. 216]|uniref:glycosyltransferase family 4 protein n=1 Tax=Dysgonomonas sp. 216 TaxID=2302934 RepID=UPI0013D79A1A|nr:glycosyltransferase family 4 protein [Dysgonomonas sp. 216]NDW18231.1 glycosyltransferase [Dysgonomonas sp. 216]